MTKKFVISSPAVPKPPELKSRLDGVSLGKDDKGYFVYTHRARSDSFDSADNIPLKDITFIRSTGNITKYASKYEFISDTWIRNVIRFMRKFYGDRLTHGDVIRGIIEAAHKSYNTHIPFEEAVALYSTFIGKDVTANDLTERTEAERGITNERVDTDYGYEGVDNQRLLECIEFTFEMFGSDPVTYRDIINTTQDMLAIWYGIELPVDIIMDIFFQFSGRRVTEKNLDDIVELAELLQDSRLTPAERQLQFDETSDSETEAIPSITKELTAPNMDDLLDMLSQAINRGDTEDIKAIKEQLRNYSNREILHCLRKSSAVIRLRSYAYLFESDCEREAVIPDENLIFEVVNFADLIKPMTFPAQHNCNEQKMETEFMSKPDVTFKRFTISKSNNQSRNVTQELSRELIFASTYVRQSTVGEQQEIVTEDDLYAISKLIWQHIAIDHNTWSLFEEELLNGTFSDGRFHNIRLDSDQVAEVRNFIDYNLNMLKQVVNSNKEDLSRLESILNETNSPWITVTEDGKRDYWDDVAQARHYAAQFPNTKVVPNLTYRDDIVSSLQVQSVDVSDELRPARWVTDESRGYSTPSNSTLTVNDEEADSIDSQAPKDADVLYDSKKADIPQFETKVDPVNKKVTIQFLDNEEKEKFENILDQQQQEAPTEVTEQVNFKEQLPGQPSLEFADAEVPVQY